MILIAGPCVIEDSESCYRIAKHMQTLAQEMGFDYYFKASFDKANRTSISAYRGPGIDGGIELFKALKSDLSVRICTDIHESWQAEYIADYVDVLQIPAFLCRQTDLLVAAAKTGKTVNVKKAQFLAPWDMLPVIQKLESTGHHDIWVCERGTTMGYNRLVVDMTSFVEMHKFGYPVIFDATHSVQLPGGLGDKTGGNRQYVTHLIRAATAVGIDGLFMEVHEDPENAKSDGPNMVKLSDVRDVLLSVKAIECLFPSRNGRQ